MYTTVAVEWNICQWCGRYICAWVYANNVKYIYTSNPGHIVVSLYEAYILTSCLISVHEHISICGIRGA